MLKIIETLVYTCVYVVFVFALVLIVVSLAVMVP